MKIKQCIATVLSAILITANVVHAEEGSARELYARYSWNGSGKQNIY